MIIARVDEVSFHRRPWGVLEDYFADRKLGLGRRRFVARLGANDLLALVSKNGMQVICVKGFHDGTVAGVRSRGLVYICIQLDRRWTLEMLQYHVNTSKIPFTIDNYKPFEEIFPKAKKAAEAIVRKAS